MTRLRRRPFAFLAPILALGAVLAGCGGSGGADEFVIRKDLVGTALTYRFDATVVAFSYDPGSQTVLGVGPTPTGETIAFSGPTTGLRTFAIERVVVDTDRDADFAEEDALPLGDGSAGSFSEDGSTVTLDLTVELGPDESFALQATGTLLSSAGG